MIFLLTKSYLSAQDTLVFSQENSVMFSNEYFLYPQSKTFEHKFKTDDGQLWYGTGTYEIKKKKLFLSFGDSEKEILKDHQITKIYDCINNVDTLLVEIIDTKLNASSGHIKFKEKYFYGGFENELLKIPKSVFGNIENPIVQTFIQGSIVNIELKEISKMSVLKIVAFDIYSYYHFESNFDRVVYFNHNELKSEDFYNTTNKRKVKFLIEK